MNRQIAIPEHFYRDHEARELPSGEVVGRKGRRILVEADDATWREILSDAEYYADPFGPDCYEGRAAMIRSAKATASAILGAWPEAKARVRRMRAHGLFKPAESSDPVVVDESDVSLRFTMEDWGGKAEGYEIRPVIVEFYDTGDDK